MDNINIKYKLVADDLEKNLILYDFTVQDIIDSGISKQQVYSVFRRGKTSLIDYRMSTLLKVVDAVENIIYEKKRKKIKVTVKF